MAEARDPSTLLDSCSMSVINHKGCTSGVVLMDSSPVAYCGDGQGRGRRPLTFGEVGQVYFKNQFHRWRFFPVVLCSA